MKAIFAIVLFVLNFACTHAPKTAVEPREGLYRLQGSNSDGAKKYDGKIILKKEGPNYRVSWLIGPELGQGQDGVGIFADGILSIGYMDNSGQDNGVVSMKVVDPGTLRGKWASLYSQGTFGLEEFVFESETIPMELRLRPLRKEP